MPQPKGSKRKNQRCHNMRKAKKEKKMRERIQEEELEMERALWVDLESRMIASPQEELEGGNSESPDGPSPSAHWDFSREDLSEDEVDSEEEVEFTDAEEGEDTRRKIAVSNTTSLSPAIRDMDTDAFTVLMADRIAKSEAMKEKHFKYQREVNPTERTLQRKAAEARKIEASIIDKVKPQFVIRSFFSTSSPPEEDPDAGKNISVSKSDLKASITAINKKIKCRKAGLQLKGQNLFRHEAVKMFLLAQQTRKPTETRLQIARDVVARCCGRGLYFARKVITWEIEWRANRTINEGKKGCFAKTHSWFNDEGVQLHIRDYLAGAGEHISAHALAKSIGEYLDSQRAERTVNTVLSEAAQPAEEDHTLSKRRRIRARTARRFLHRMGFSYKNVTKNVYIDGHERPDVIEYRQQVFLPEWKTHSRRFVLFNEDGTWEFPKGLQVGEKPLVLVTHDESTFNANDGKRRVWVKDGKMPLRQKSRGKGIMVSGFLTPAGPLRVPDNIPDSELLADLYCKWPCHPSTGDNYWTGEKMVNHLVNIAIPIFRKAFPCCQALFAFDNASNHVAFADDALVAGRMNLSPGGANVPRMRETFMHGKGLPQHMVFPDNHERVALRGKPKGMEQVLRERGLWRDRNAAGIKFRAQCPTRDGRQGCPTDPNDPSFRACCARTVLAEERDFREQKGLLAESTFAVGHEVIFYPKFHCELNFIERFWCAAKYYARENCKYSLEGLRETIPLALASVSVNSILHYYEHCVRTIQAYDAGLTYGSSEFGEHMKKHKAHRQVPDPSKY
ncbi:hypothetical protein BJ508DRAFT_349096 [Ascobolus immersus RN42]|uniref:Tc1-like transposase DDE domain-containing protein n=1 Tax=Ascobolus immersus RN42 TaxID=1160509 RepID=A0A3N4I378_ASCIM|nr:hypothetical protein BJ508DRAFT_349096 [Ascobolus immersus RN42]